MDLPGYDSWKHATPAYLEEDSRCPDCDDQLDEENWCVTCDRDQSNEPDPDRYREERYPNRHSYGA